MRKNTWLTVLLWPILFSACALGTPAPVPADCSFAACCDLCTAAPALTPTPTISATSLRLYKRLVEEGTLLDQMTKTGVNFRDFSEQFARYESVHTMIFEVANNALDQELVLEMDRVVAGWGEVRTLLASESKQLITTTASGHFHKVRTEILGILEKQGE